MIDHPEGGKFLQVFKSNSIITREDGQKRSALTHIYFSLQKGEVILPINNGHTTLSGSTIILPLGDSGVFIAGSNSTVIDNEIISSDGFADTGIFFDLGADNSTVLSNRISSFSNYGMEICSDGNFFAQNIVELTGL
ncbi:cupin domain-containing protein [Microbulbifer sp. A4B17]|uniref:cupin domain-containing protein n=1 Tax=Microbulbifer sp. A4B17 TaxID=359370 RepID=UPI0021043945|nr:cupin domain-containing protein [Microbulbifer sp. A4B17]